jgi:hypothetical protein
MARDIAYAQFARKKWPRDHVSRHVEVLDARRLHWYGECMLVMMMARCARVHRNMSFACVTFTIAAVRL